MSLPIDEIVQILRDNGHITDTKALQAAAKDLIAAEKEAKADKQTTPKGKTRLVALVRQDPGSTTLGGAYLVAVPDLAEPEGDTYVGASLLARLRKAATEHNDAPKARRAKAKVKVTTWSDLFRFVKAKTLKASGSAISVRAKGDPVELVVLSSESIAP